MKTMGSFFLTLNRLLLGGFFVFSAYLKMFVIKPEGVTNMVANLGFPLPLFFAWVLILGDWFMIIVHLILASNLLALGSLSGSKERKRPEINRPRVQKTQNYEKKVVEVKSKKVTPKKPKKKTPKKN